MRKRAFPRSGDVGYRIPFRRDRFTAIEHRCAFNRFECGNVPFLDLAIEPFLDLAIEAVGYVAVESTNPSPNGSKVQNPP